MTPAKSGASLAALEATRKGIISNVAASGAFRMEQLKTVTATEAMTNAIVKEEVSIRRLLAERKTMNNVIKEQIQLQRMSAMQWTESGIAGKKTSQFMIPREATESVKTFGNGLVRGNVALGTWAHAIGASSNNIIKWGKNTQWAGRQLMMGLTLPILALGAAAGKLAYDLNVEFTKIVKVYDFTSEATNQAAEQTKLFTDSMNTARTMAKAYGADAKETLGILADLAATGEKGVELQRTAAIVTKAAFLGDLNREDAIKATIALQNTFHHSNAQLNDDFAYMTAVANGTSLSMEDFVVALPRVAGVVQTLGGDIKSVGLLMTAMRAASVGAAEGANTIKSVLFRAQSATTSAKDSFLKIAKMDLDKLIESAEGDPVVVLQKIGEALEGIANDQDRLKLSKDLFGLFQGSKALAMVKALADANGQVGVTMKINAEESDKYYDSVDQATEKLQSSVSGRFKIMLASMKLSLSESGKAFLGAAISALGAVKAVLDAFNNLPSGIKATVMWTAIILAIGGAVLMLVGVLANLTGQILKTGAGMVRMATGFKVVTPAMKAQQLMAEQAALALDKEASQAAVLQAAMMELAIGTTRAAYAQEIFNKKLAEGNAQQALSKATAMAAQNPVVATNTGGWRSATTGTFVSANSPAVAAEKARLAALRESEAATLSLGRVEQAQANAVLGVQNKINAAGAVGLKTTQETGVAMQRVRGAGLGTVGMLTLLVGGTHTWAIGLGVVLMMMGSIDLAAKKAAISQALAIGKQEKAFASLLPSATKVGGAVRGWSAGLRGFAGSLAASIGPLGWIMIAAAAIGGSIMLWKKKSEEGAKAFAKLGDVAKNSAEALGAAYDESGASAANANKDIKDQISLSQKLGKVNKDQVKTLSEMSNNEAKNYVQQIGLQFYLGTGDQKQSERVMESLLIAAGKKPISKDVKINFEAPDETALDQLTSNLGNITSGTYKAGTWEKMFQGRDDLSQAAGKAGRDQGKMFAMALNDEISKNDMKGAKELADKGAKVFQDNIDKAQAAYNKDKSFDNEAALKHAQEGYKNFLDGLLTQAGISTKGIHTLQDALNAMAGYVPPPEGLAALPGLIKTLGLSADIAAGQLITDFGDLGWAGDQFEALGSAIQSTGTDLERAQAAATAFTNAAKNSMTTAWGDVLSHAADQMADRHQATMDAIDANSKKRDDEAKRAANAAKKAFDLKEKAWDKGWDAREKARDKYWDARKKSIQDQIDAEQDAEKKRQAIFEAEKTRLERLSEMYNKNIDFNVALNTGNLDEAAKVQNDMAGTEQGWAIDDASAGSANASDQRVSVLQARLDALDVQQKAEKDAMEAQKAREKEALDAEKEALDASVQANEAAEAKKTEAAKNAAAASYKARKDALDMELATLQAFIPKDAAELKAHIADIEAAYARHGMGLDTKSKEWADYVSRAITSSTATAEQSLETDIKWAQIGAKAGEDLATGILDMSFKDFTNWMLTGKVPETGPGANHFSEGTIPSKRYPHGGGHIGSSTFKSNRLGRPLSSDLYSDEIPAILQKGEFVIKKSVVDKVGAGNLHALNNGMSKMDKTGRMHDGGLAGAAGKIYKTFKDGLGMAMTAGAIRKSQELAAAGKGDQIPGKFQEMFGATYASGEAGKYGGTSLDAKQLQNASAIVNVGKNMGATQRDLIVSLMTAMQESTLRNLPGGDRDSVGLFQQRPSQGWGSVEQIMNPAYAAHKFFEHLLAIKDRDKMPLTAEAQAVQRSAFPMAYAKWESTARAILGGMSGTATNAIAGGWGNPDAPGYAQANIVSAGTAGLSWSQNRLAGNRFVGLVNALIGQGYRPSTVQGYNNRNIAGSDNKSNHAYGAAIDIDPSRNPRYGSGRGGPYALPANSAQIASAFGLNWGGTYKSSKDYMHFEVLGSPSAPKVPGMSIGGTIKYDNTIANLHKDEKVLTAPLSKSLERGINAMSEKAGDQYLFNFDGATFAKEIDVERAVTKVLNARDARVGRTRTVGK